MNYFAIVVAALASTAIGGAWYARFLFGRQWMRLRGVHPAQETESPTKEILLQFVASLVTAYVLSVFALLLGAHTAYGALVLALIVWVGFYATTLLGGVVWEKTPFGLFLINSGMWLVSLVAMTLIVGIW